MDEETDEEGVTQHHELFNWESLLIFNLFRIWKTVHYQGQLGAPAKLKHKATCVLKISPNVPEGFNRPVREVLGLNNSNPLEVAEKIETRLRKEIRMFFNRKDNCNAMCQHEKNGC